MRAIALLLDKSHAARVPFIVDVPAGQRPLAVLERAAHEQLGVGLSFSLGRLVVDDDHWFVFLFETVADAVPHRTWTSDARFGAAWQVYVAAVLGGWEPPTRVIDVWHFGSTPVMAAKLAHNVLRGNKRATTGWIEAAEREGLPLPVVGGLSIVTDGLGIPLAVLETERVERCRFGDATEEIAIGESEGDASFEDWRAGHGAYFADEAHRLGLTFSEDSLLVFEYFRVVTRL